LFDLKKKWIVSVVLLCVISGCETNDNDLAEPERQNDVVVSKPVPSAISGEKIVYDGLRTRDQAAWPAKYGGTLPCTDCPGIETTLVLIGDGTYLLSETYLEQGIEPFGATGRFTWNTSGTVITLDAEGGGRSYQVEKNALRALDSNGQIISGEFADDYVLENLDTEFSGAYVWGHDVHVFSPCDSDDTYSVMATPATIEQLIKHYKLKSTKAYQALFVQFRGHLVFDEALLVDTDDYDGIVRIDEVLEWNAVLPTHCRGR
jgi:uncharacterized lipoprotein NlpE involved in copper resistance